MGQTIQTGCVIAGGGPAGMMLAVLLARRGVDVTLVESHGNFDRDFRGDTVHPATLDALDKIGLADGISARARARIREFSMCANGHRFILADFSHLKTRFPFITMVSQEDFLDFLADKLRTYPQAKLIMQTRATDLLKNDRGRICGITCEKIGDAPFAIHAQVVIAADGRNSTLRAKAGLDLVKTAPPMDVIWFRLPHKDTDFAAGGSGINISAGSFVVVIDRGSYWQIGFVILKGGFKQLKEKGMDVFKSTLTQVVPFLSDGRLDELKDWNQTSLLSVQTGYLEKWSLPGFLAIGDAAHIMSPVGGVGINYAVQDAICTANTLAPHLLQSTEQFSPTELDHALDSIQKKRFASVRAIQKFQELVQSRIVSQALNARGEFTPPLPLRLLARFRFFRGLLARFLVYGLRHELLET